MEKRCSRCGGTYHAEAFFRRDPGRVAAYAYAAKRRSVCIGCELTARTTSKETSRWRVKARDTLNRHADRFIADGLATSRDEFAERFGWDVDRMAHEAEHAYSNGCAYCGHPFLAMGHGLADITLDIVDPEASPYYANTRWCCGTCNREKGRTPIRLWGAKLADWKRWRKRQDELRVDRHAGTLFEGLDVGDI